MKLFRILRYEAAMALLASILFPMSGLAQYGNTVREDRSWEYRLMRFNFALLEEESLISGYHFKGTEEVDGIRYAVFRHPDGTRIALMRQEDSRVYLLLEDECFTDPETGKYISGEVLLYDFSLKSGDTFKCAGFYEDTFSGMLVECRITDVYDVTYAGNSSICQEFRHADGSYPWDTFTAIEGVGNLSGLLSFPQFSCYTSDTRNLYIVQSVRDNDSKLIYENPSNGVKVPIDSETDADNSGLYDIFGRRVCEPVQGGIYIQAGKKTIWR